MTGSSSLGRIIGFAFTPDGSRAVSSYNFEGVQGLSVSAAGALAPVGSALATSSGFGPAVSPDGRFLYYQYFDVETHEDGIGVAELGADGVPTPLPAFAPFYDGSEAERIVLAPEPAPTAAFSATPGAPGAATSFDASASGGAVRYDWDFGDGTTLEDGGPTPSHVYASPGSYTAMLRVTDANGCSTKQIYTGQSTVCPGGSGAAASRTVVVAPPESPGTEGDGGTTATSTTTTPRILSFAVTHRRFAVAGSTRSQNHRHHRRSPLGTAFRYRLDEAATVRFTIERRRTGRHVRFVKLGALTAKAKSGLGTTAFSGRLHGRRLSPGSYRVTAVASAAGKRSRPRRASFRVLAG